MTTENFEQLLKENLESIDMREGSLITGIVQSIDNNVVTLHLGLKTEGRIPVSEFHDEFGEIEIEPNALVKVLLETVEDGKGQTLVSREKAKKIEVWNMLESAWQNKETIQGKLGIRVKGGYTVEIGGIRGFLPGSLLDIRPVVEPSAYERRKLEFMIIKFDPKRNNLVLSRRAALEREDNEERKKLLENLKEGAITKGIVKNLTSYGAFVDIGGVDGLLHVGDMSWKRVKDPSEVVKVGEEYELKIIRFDQERMRVSLGLKQMSADPWIDVETKYPINSKHKATVTNITDYGCFMEIEQGIEGLVHFSEIDWVKKHHSPNQLVSENEEYMVKILQTETARRRISLSIKQCQLNPWELFAENNKSGSMLTGTISSLTEFGIFVAFEEGIEGMVYIGNLIGKKSRDELLQDYKKGQKIEVEVVQIESDRERILLTIPELTKKESEFMDFFDKHKKGDVIEVEVLAQSEDGVKVKIDNENEAVIKTNQVYRKDHGDQEVFTAGEKVNAMITLISRKRQDVQLSIRNVLESQEKEAIGEFSKQVKESGASTLGDIFGSTLDVSSLVGDAEKPAKTQDQQPEKPVKETKAETEKVVEEASSETEVKPDSAAKTVASKQEEDTSSTAKVAKQATKEAKAEESAKAEKPAKVEKSAKEPAIAESEE